MPIGTVRFRIGSAEARKPRQKASFLWPGRQHFPIRQKFSPFRRKDTSQRVEGVRLAEDGSGSSRLYALCLVMIGWCCSWGLLKPFPVLQIAGLTLVPTVNPNRSLLPDRFG